MRPADVFQRPNLVVHVVQRDPHRDDIVRIEHKVRRIAMEDQRRRAGGLVPNLVLRQSRSARPTPQDRHDPANIARGGQTTEVDVGLVNVHDLDDPTTATTPHLPLPILRLGSFGRGCRRTRKSPRGRKFVRGHATAIPPIQHLVKAKAQRRRDRRFDGIVEYHESITTERIAH